jgi:hypothetical protein
LNVGIRVLSKNSPHSLTFVALDARLDAIVCRLPIFVVQ